MSRSRRKNWNTVNAASLARWIVLTAFLAAHRADLRLSDDSALSSGRPQEIAGDRAGRSPHPKRRGQRADCRPDFAVRLAAPAKEGYLKMIPISERHIVRLNLPARPEGGDRDSTCGQSTRRPMKWN